MNTTPAVLAALVAAADLGTAGAPMHDVARTLAEASIAVFPCDPKTKQPLTQHAFKDRTNDLDQVLKWWTEWPTAAPGIVPADAGLAAFDVDSPAAFAAARGAGVVPVGLLDALRTGQPLGPEFGLIVATGGASAPFMVDGVEVPPLHVYAAVNGAKPRVKGLVVRYDAGYVIAPGAKVRKVYSLLARGEPAPYATQPEPAPDAAPSSIDPARVRAALMALPNTGDAFADREKWIGVAHMVRGALGDAGRDMFLEWSAQYPTSKPEENARVWDTLPPSDLGWAALWQLAERYGRFDAAPEKRAEARADFPSLDVAPAASSPAPRTFHLLDDVELEDATDPEWLLQDILQADTYAVLYGDSEGGKTFTAIDWALCVGTGTAWRGHAVKRGPVVYVGAEGKSGFKSRVRAWKRAHHFVGRADVYFVSAIANVRDPATLRQLLADIRAKLGDQRPVLIALDTLNRHLAGGDENSSKDIGLANAFASALREATGATVMYVHHCRKGDEQERGHSSLRNAADTMIHLKIADDGVSRELTCTKQRDADHFAPLTFTLRKEGDSLVIDDARSPGSGALAGPNDVTALGALIAQYNGTDAVPVGQWEKVTPLPERTFLRVRARLEKGGLVTRAGLRGGYKPTTAGMAAHAESVRARVEKDFAPEAGAP